MATIRLRGHDDPFGLLTFRKYSRTWNITHLKDGIPAEVSASARRDDSAAGPALEDEGLVVGAGRVAERAHGVRGLVVEVGQQARQAVGAQLLEVPLDVGAGQAAVSVEAQASAHECTE